MIDCLGGAWRIVTREELGKPEARVVDVTCGNRHIHRDKFSPYIVYIDSCRDLVIEPDVLADNRRLPFVDRYWDDGCAVFDPPHMWRFDADKERCKWIHKYPGEDGPIKASWWGFYKTRRQMMVEVNQTQHELARVTKRLCLKWAKVEIPLNNVLTLFTDWSAVFIQEYYRKGRQPGHNKVFWVKMVRKNGLAGGSRGGDLLSFIGDRDADRETVVQKAALPAVGVD